MPLRQTLGLDYNWKQINMGEQNTHTGNRWQREGDYNLNRQGTAPRPHDPKFFDSVGDVREAHGLGTAFGDYGQTFSRGEGDFYFQFSGKNRWGKNTDITHHYYGQKDFVISDKLDDLYDVFSAAYDPDLAFKAVGGADIYTSGTTSWDKVRESDPATYDKLMTSERRRRQVYGESFFQ